MPADGAYHTPPLDWLAALANLHPMEIRPTPDQEAFIRQAVEAGRIAHPEDAVMQALTLWEDRERRRLEILDRIDAAERSIARGEGIEITPDSMRALAEGVKHRGRARLKAENPTPR